MSEHTELMARLELQNKEFDALRDLTKKFDALCETPVVDDDYPEMRHYYESALRSFLSALKNNRTKLYLESIP